MDLSTHEKRLAALREQIKELETENVAPKDWVLMGEAGSRARPQNSLLEEDLEFERVMKAVPVVTEETVLALEERIKARILESQFDDVVRVRPMDDKPFLPSRFFELKDSKSSQSLAQIYEDEYTAASSGGTAGEDRDGKLKKEHDEIDQLWESICNKLDALCNAHYMPKQVSHFASSFFMEYFTDFLLISPKQRYPRLLMFRQLHWSLLFPLQNRRLPCLPLKRCLHPPHQTFVRVANSLLWRSAPCGPRNVN